MRPRRLLPCPMIHLSQEQVRSGKARKRARIVLSEYEDTAEDPSKQGRKIAQIDTDPTISLKKLQLSLLKTLEVVKKGEKEISTADVPVSTVGAEVSTARHDVSTVAATLVYIRRSVSKAKDKGKTIMQEPEPPKKLKKRVQQEQERINFEAALELQRHINEREEVPAEATQSQTIDWSDPAPLRYHALQNRPYSVAKVKKNMVVYLKNQARYKQCYFKGMKYEEIRPIFEKKTLARKRAGEKKSEESSKRQKNEEAAADYEQEKAELRLWLKVAQDDEESVNPEILSTKYPIVDWEHQLLGQMGGKDFKVYKLTRADGSASYHGNIQAFLRRLYREDLSTLYILINMLVEKKYPLMKDLLEKMLNLQLEAEEESTMAFELLKFIKSQIEEHRYEEVNTAEGFEDKDM
ncbi:hypothetical protein Tco_0983172 [Tanacetum coccineum]